MTIYRRIKVNWMNINSAMTTRIGLCGEDANFDQDIHIYIYIYTHTHCCLPLHKCPHSITWSCICTYTYILSCYTYIYILSCSMVDASQVRFLIPPSIHACIPPPNLMISLANNETMHLCYQNYVLNPFFFSNLLIFKNSFPKARY